MRITALHLHPIKGCHRVEVDRAVVSPYGLAGDREWQIVPVDRNEFLTQRGCPQLTRIRPAISDGGLVLRADGMPDLAVATPAVADRATPTYTGDVQVGDGGDAAAEWLTAVVAEEVRLVGIAPGYHRQFGDVFATESAFGDLAPLLVVNDASHDFLAERAVEPFGPERWRGNVFVDAAAPWVEDTWRTLRVGDVTVRVVLPWPRCAVPQVDQETGVRHREPALVLRQHRWCTALPDSPPIAQAMLPGNALFGVAGSIEPVGAAIAVGDEVEVLETGEALLRR